MNIFISAIQDLHGKLADLAQQLIIAEVKNDIWEIMGAISSDDLVFSDKAKELCKLVHQAGELMVATDEYFSKYAEKEENEKEESPIEVEKPAEKFTCRHCNSSYGPNETLLYLMHDETMWHCPFCKYHNVQKKQSSVFEDL